jgi:DNA-binding MarR family transcriptional regulator
MDSGALAHTLKPLVRDGFLVVSIDANDRRNRLVNLTRRGQAKINETDALWAQAQAGFQAAFGKANSESLRDMMRLLISDEFTAAYERAISAV